MRYESYDEKGSNKIIEVSLKFFKIVEMIEMAEMIVVLVDGMIYIVDGHFHLFSSVLK